MDDQRFDALTRALARGSSRRTAIKGLAGGLIGSVPLVTQLGRASAQDECDCVAVPCKSLSCDNGECVYTDLCTDPCTPCNEQTGACDPITCGPCEWCSQGECTGGCGNGFCCDGQCQLCCSTDDCPEDPYQCSEVVCNGGVCEAYSACSEGQQCCNAGTADSYCAECCDSSECTDAPCGSCYGGGCEYNQCCYPDHPCTEPCHICSSSGCINLCKQSEECCGGDCVAIGTCCRESGQTCAVTEGPGTQGNCCADLLCCATGEGGNCQECCHDDDCAGCSFCNLGVCTDHCVEGRRCCEGECIPDDECCSVDPECPPNHFCCGKGEAGAHCAFCCEDNQCDGEFGYCEDGHCQSGECRSDSDCPDCSYCSDHMCMGRCSQSQECCDGDCVTLGTCCKGPGDMCGEVAFAADGPGQYDCCDGLLCCFGQQYNNCAYCCSDNDCDPGGTCEQGGCTYPSKCDHDRDCPKGTCCCDNGDCSHHCCPKPPKPHPHPQPPAPAPSGGGSVTTMPVTGSGTEKSASGLLGAAALGAAALFAAKTLRDQQATGITEAPPVEE